MDKSPLSDIINPLAWTFSSQPNKVCHDEKKAYDKCDYEHRRIYVGLNCDEYVDKYVKCLENDVKARRGII
jgi:hypothetical protein